MLLVLKEIQAERKAQKGVYLWHSNPHSAQCAYYSSVSLKRQIGSRHCTTSQRDALTA
jgi:hypothetical protein